MLVIRRRAGESVLIGDGVEVEVLEIAGNQVKIGISAPRDVLILRREIRLTAEQNELAARSMPFASLVGLLEKMKQYPQGPQALGDKGK
ncbi:MAG: carbon storage regulator [Bryobacteraceae bacterium]